MSKREIPIITAHFDTRLERSTFVAEKFSPYLADSVVDVGCFEAPLRQILTNRRYIGVDIAGNPDIQLNLDAIETLPFADKEFTTALCIEVLEHLDNLHRVFGELVRVSNKYIIVSLPNCWRDARRPLERGKGNFAHYGLPVERPLDRHKWFFSLSQAREFLTGMGIAHQLSVVDMFAAEPRRNALVKYIRHLRYPGEAYYNRYAQTIWVVFSK